MQISVHTTVLPHTDPDASLTFWRDVLGFEVRNDVGEGSMRWLGLGAPGQPDVTVLLSPPAVEPGITDAERTTVTEMMAKGTYGWILLSSTDLDADFDSIQAHEVEVVQEPTDQPYGIRDCAFRDPAGNLIRIRQA